MMVFLHAYEIEQSLQSNGLLADDSIDIKNWVHITSDELRYFSESKRTYLYEKCKNYTK